MLLGLRDRTGSGSRGHFMAKEPVGSASGAVDRAVGDSPLVTVLVVEDEFLIRMSISDELRLAGWTVYEAATADYAIDFLRSPLAVDLVLTDVRMPGVSNGLDVAAFVRKTRPGVKVAVMSGHYVPDWREQNLFDQFLSKPVIVDLVRTLGELINGNATAENHSVPASAADPKDGNNPDG